MIEISIRLGGPTGESFSCLRRKRTAFFTLSKTGMAFSGVTRPTRIATPREAIVIASKTMTRAANSSFDRTTGFFFAVKISSFGTASANLAMARKIRPPAAALVYIARFEFYDDVGSLPDLNSRPTSNAELL